MDKKTLRDLYKRKRSALTTVEVRELSRQLVLQAGKLPVWGLSNFHVFLSIERQNEPQTQPLIDFLFGENKNVIVSKPDHQTGTLTHFRFGKDTKLIEGKYGIPEPAGGLQVDEKEIDVVFIPLLAFDEAGNRVGYGKGFYDRFLHKCRPGAIKIGWSFFEAEKQIGDVLPTDIRLDFCVTPGHIYKF